MTDLALPGVRLGLQGLLIASQWGLANRLALSPVHKCRQASLSAPKGPQHLETITVLVRISYTPVAFREVNRKFSRRGKRKPAEGPQLPSEGPDWSLAVEVSSQGKVTHILHSSQSKKLEYICKKDSACQAFAYLCLTSTPVNSLSRGCRSDGPEGFPLPFPFLPHLVLYKRP